MRLSIILVITSLCSAQSFTLDKDRSSVNFEIVTPMGSILADGELVSGRLNKREKGTELEVTGRNLSLKTGSLSARAMVNALFSKVLDSPVFAKGIIVQDGQALATIQTQGRTHKRTIPITLNEISKDEIQLVGRFPREDILSLEGSAVFNLYFARS